MTNEEKQLLFKDLCARLPYKVYVQCVNGIDTLTDGNFSHLFVSVYDIKPYLRSMSSMTEEENNHYINTFICMWDAVDWLNSHHFDYRGLIEKGLAIEAPKDMYKTE